MLSHRRRTTVSLETYPFIHLLFRLVNCVSIVGLPSFLLPLFLPSFLPLFLPSLPKWNSNTLVNSLHGLKIHWLLQRYLLKVVSMVPYWFCPKKIHMGGMKKKTDEKNENTLFRNIGYRILLLINLPKKFNGHPCCFKKKVITQTCIWNFVLLFESLVILCVFGYKTDLCFAV